MAIGNIRTLFVGSTSDSTANNVWTVTLTAGAPANDRVWVIFACDGGDADPNNPTFNTTDSKGNNWSTFTAPVRNGVTGGTVMLYAATAIVASPLTAGDTVTITEPTDTFGLTRRCTVVMAASGILPGSATLEALEMHLSSDPGSVSSLSIGPTPTTSTDEQLVLAFWGGGVRAFTPGAGYTELAETATAVGSADRQLSVAYKVTSAAGPQTATGTLASATTVIGDLTTWLADAAAAPEATHYLRVGSSWVPAEATLL